MPYTTPSTVTGSDVLTAALWNTQIRDNFEEVAKPYSCRASRYAGSTLSLVAGFPTTINWTANDTRNWDFTGMHDLSVNPERILLPEAGIYMASTWVNVRPPDGVTSVIQLYIQRFDAAGIFKDTFGVSAFTAAPGPQTSILTAQGLTKANANDYITVDITSFSANATAFHNDPFFGTPYPITVHQVSKHS
jgi:hypothetical protein